MLQLHHFHVGARSHVQRRNDLGDALQVVCVVGDDQGVAARIGVDGVVGADQGPQHRHQVVGVLVAQRKDLGDDLVAPHRDLSHADRSRLQLGVGFGHHLEQATGLNHGKAQSTQGREVAGVGVANALRLFAVNRDGALHTRVDHDGAVDHGGKGAGHGLDVGVDKIHGHWRPALGRHLLRHGRRQGHGHCQQRGQALAPPVVKTSVNARVKRRLVHVHPIEMRDSAP